MLGMCAVCGTVNGSKNKNVSTHSLIDSASTRRKLIKTVCSILEAEAHLPVNWHLRLQRGKAEKDTVFIVCDPSNAVDAKLSDAIRTELSKAGFSTYQRADVEQDTRMIAPAISASSYILLLLTPFSAVKDVVFNDLLLADFFDKVSPTRTCVCVFKRSAFRTLPYRVQAVLSDATAIDFESEPYAKCKQFLLFWFKPTFTMNGVLMDQAFVDRMQNGLQKFAQLLRVSAELGDSPSTGTNVSDSPPFANEAVSRVSQPLFSHAHTYASMSVEEPLSRMTLTLNSKYTVYFSYSPELHSRLQKLHAVLELNNYTAYLPAAVNCLVGTTPSSDDVQSSNNLLALRNSQILVLCVTQNYIVSPPCLQDAVHAQQLGKAIVPVLFSITKWPPSNAQLREILNGNKLVDFSSDKFFVRHMPYFLERVRSALMLGSIMKQS